MIITRRRLLTGLIAAPIVITTPGLLMPVKALQPDMSWWIVLRYDDKIDVQWVKFQMTIHNLSARTVNIAPEVFP